LGRNGIVTRRGECQHADNVTKIAVAETEPCSTKLLPRLSACCPITIDKLIAGLSKETFETQVEKGAAWVGTPETTAIPTINCR
jgi:hypothetical protein